MREKIIKIINYFIELVISSTVFLVPLYFSFFYRDFSAFSLDKTMLFAILIEFLLMLTLIKVVLEKEIIIYIKKEFLLIILPFFLSLVLCTIFSQDIHNSFYGSYWRQQGLFTYVHYFLFFIIVIINVNKKEKAKRIINIILLASFFVSLYGILQWLGIDSMPWHKKVPIGGRVISTMGQPVFVGNYLLLVIFLTFYKIFVNKRFFTRFLWLILFVFQFLCLVFTYSRGAWLGFIFGILLMIFLYFYIGYLNRRKIFRFLLIVVSLLLFCVIIFNATSKDQMSSSFILRIKSIVDFKSGSTALRIKYWRAGLDAISKKPFLGHGLENQHEVLVSYYRPDWAIFETINTSPDRLHNEFLELALSGGFVALLSYLFILGFIFWLGLMLIKRTKDSNRWLVFFLLVSIFSYLFALLFNFSSTETNLLFWLYIALIFLIFNNYQRALVLNIGNREKVYFIIVFIVILSNFILGYQIIKSINSVKADIYFKKARNNFAQNQFPEMFNNYIWAIDLNNKEEFYKLFFINDSLYSLPQVNSEYYSRKVLEFIKNNFEINEATNNYSEKIIKSIELTMLAKYENEKYFIEAEKSFYELVRESPYMPDTYKNWGLLYIYKNDYKKALVIYNTILSMLPDSEVSSIYNEHINEINNFIMDIYQNMALCYFKLGELDKQIEYYKKIISINPYRMDIYEMIAKSYYLKGDLNSAIWYNKRGYMLNPNDYNWPLAIALLYKERGDLVSAKEYGEKTLKLAPNNKQIELLLK